MIRTSTPLAHASPPARKPALKRRRLNPTIDSARPPSRTLTDNSNAGPPVPNAPTLSLGAKLLCATCHRALSTAIRPGVAGPCMCSRCAAPTCAICARTCTSYTCPPSMPPTPALTRSPSPCTQTTSPAGVSPKRAALGLSYATMNCCDACAALAPLPAIKRKKPPVDKEDGDGSAGSRGLLDAVSVQGGGGGGAVVTTVAVDATESTVVSGCGRVVCRACCVESVSNDGLLCVDCFALV